MGRESHQPGYGALRLPVLLLGNPPSYDGVGREDGSKHDAIWEALLCSIFPFPITSQYCSSPW